MGSLGDLVRGLCLPGEIKRQWPAATVSWLVEPPWEPLVDFHPLIDDVIVFDRPRGVAAVGELRRELRKRHFDITLDLQRHFKSGVFSLLSKAPCRIGVHPRNAKEFNWVFNNRHLPCFSMKRPKLDHYLQYIDTLGIRPSARPDFGFSALGRDHLPEPLKAEQQAAYLVVVMGSSWVSKDWTAKGYLELVARLLARENHDVVLVGDRSQTAAAEEIANALKSNHLLNLAGQTSLLELAATLKLAAACVGPDSGPGHIAAAVGTPYVALFGPTDPDRVAPYRCRLWVVQADHECRGCYRKTCDYTGINCMEAITADMAIRMLDRALAAGRLF
jgi:lipopolysaccharide heptosyltransferase II